MLNGITIFIKAYLFTKLSCVFTIQPTLPSTFLHFAGRSEKRSFWESFIHFKSDTQVPQKKLFSGLKHDPHTSPSCLVPSSESTDVSKTKTNMYTVVLRFHILLTRPSNYYVTHQIPGHFLLLQVSVSENCPLQVPPNSSVGSSFRLFVRIPPPQLLLQVSMFHSLHKQFSVRCKIR